MPALKAKLNVTRIDKGGLFPGKKGTYLDVVFMENRDGRDEYGNDGFIVQDLGKEARERGERGPILGNWSYWDDRGRKNEPQRAPTSTPQDRNEGADPDDDIPF